MTRHGASSFLWYLASRLSYLVPTAVMRRRVAQDRAEKEVQMSEPAGRVSALPALAEQRSEPEGPTHSARLLFAYFLLAKQEKVSALSGAHPDMQRNQTS